MEKPPKTLRKWLILITYTLVLGWLLMHSGNVAKVVKGIVSLASPLLVGFCIAFVMNILLRPLEALWTKGWKRVLKKCKKPSNLPKKLKRPVCLLLTFVIVLSALFAILFIVLPELEQTIASLIDSLPGYLNTINTWWQELREFALKHEVELPELNLNTDELVASLRKYFTENFNVAMNTTLNVTLAIFSSITGTIVDLVMAVIFSLYMLSQKEKLRRQLTRLLYAVIPGEKGQKVLEIMSLSSLTFTNYVTGQLTEALILGGLCFVGMLIFGMPYAPVVAVLIGFTALIPIFGAFIGAAIGAFLILLVSPVKAFWFVIFIVILQQLEGNLIYPRVVGKSVGLPGIWVLAAVSIGGGAFGFIGMLISVPCCAVLYSLIRQFVHNRAKDPAQAA